MMKKKNKKRLLIFLASITGIIIVLGIIFNQLLYFIIFQTGYVEVHKGNNERGNKLMSFAVSRMDNPPAKIYHALSVQNTKNGNYSIAISALEKAYKLDPNDQGAYYGWVLLYYYHDYEKALTILNEYDELTPNFSDSPMGECIHYLKGLAYMQLNKYQDAVREFNTSIENASFEHGSDWIDYQVYLNNGICLLYLNKNEEAILEFDKTISDYNKCAEAFFYKGVSQLKLNLKNDACQNLKKAKDLINEGYKSSDVYVELFHEIYQQQVEDYILKNCTN